MATVAATTPRVRPRGTLSERFVRFWNRYLLFIYTGGAIKLGIPITEQKMLANVAVDAETPIDWASRSSCWAPAAWSTRCRTTPPAA